jgi:WD40 repeat protein
VAAPPAGKGPARLDLHGDPLPPGALVRLGALRLRHEGTLRWVAYSPDSKYLASAGSDRTTRLWEVATGKEARHFVGPKQGMEAIAFSPDGKLLAGAGVDGTVYLWEVATGKEARRLEGHPGGAASVAFSPRGNILASSGSRDHTVRLWDTATWTVLREIRGGGPTLSLTFAPDGKALAGAGDDKTVRLWDAATGRELHVLRGHAGAVHCVAFSPDGRSLVTGDDQGARLWEAATGKQARLLTGHHGGTVHAAAFAPDGKTLATGGWDHTIRFWEADTGRQRRAFEGHADWVVTLAFAPDGKSLASGSAEPAIHLWDADTGQPLRLLPGHQERVPAVAFSPDGRSVATGGWDNTVRLWGAVTGKPLARWDANTGAKPLPLGAGPDAIRQLTFSPDGRLLASVTHGEAVLVWEVATGKRRFRLRGSRAAFSPDGKVLACAGRGEAGAELNVGFVRLYDSATGKELRALRGRGPMISCLAFSPDGKSLVAGGYWGGTVPVAPGDDAETIQVWDLASGRRRGAFGGHRGLVGLAFSPDGKTLATVDLGEQTVRLWEVASAGKRAQLRGHDETIFAIAFAPDGKALASASMDGTVRLWELPSGRELARFRGHRGWALGVAFAPDGKSLASSSTDTTALVWDLRGLAARASRGPRPGELPALWADLGSPDAGKAYRAFTTLAGPSKQTVPFLRERLRPAAPLDSKWVARRIAELDSDRFEKRQQAADELERLGERAEPALRQALKGKPSLEAHRRLQALLDKVTRAAPSGARLQALRAVEVLERLDGPQAREVLTRLAAGPPEARLTQEAQAALRRLARRPAP